ncbi:ANTAR domain-containing protein [Streptomyces sp. NPDC052301]|uniref:ANTAR domain-containing protein n=1 Tax=Streptomyces sp. NPDC052301 TaxID=3365687 RepID=UPI0037D479DA
MFHPQNDPAVRVGARPLPGREDLLNKIGELQNEIGQLHNAVVSHAVVDQAIGVVIAVGGLRPDQGFEILRQVSQTTNIKLRQVAEQIVDWTSSESLPDEIRHALDAALSTARSA